MYVKNVEPKREPNLHNVTDFMALGHSETRVRGHLSSPQMWGQRSILFQILRSLRS